MPAIKTHAPMSSTNQDYYKCSEYLYLPKVSSKLSPFCFWTLEAGPEKWQQWALHPAACYPVWFMGGTVKRAQGRGTSLVVQWLRFWASSARGCGFDLAQGTKIPHAMQHGHKNKNLKKKNDGRELEAGGRVRAGCLFSLFLSGRLPWLSATHSFWVHITTLFPHPFRQAKGR